MHDGVRGRHVVVALERWLAGEHLGDHAAAGKDIGARVGRVAVDLFGRHVRRGAQHRPRFGAKGFARLLQLRDSEIEDLEPPALGDEEVLRLQIAVDDARFVRRGQTVRQLHGEVEYLRRRQRAVAERRAQRPPLQQLADDERLAVVLADVVDRDDVRMVQRASGPSLLLESLPSRSRSEDLERDLTADLRVPRAQHAPHGAAADLAVDGIAPGVHRDL